VAPKSCAKVGPRSIVAGHRIYRDPDRNTGPITIIGTTVSEAYGVRFPLNIRLSAMWLAVIGCDNHEGVLVMARFFEL